MSQLDMITYYGQLFTTVVTFIFMNVLVVLVLRPYTHKMSAFWVALPGATSMQVAGYGSETLRTSNGYVKSFMSIVSLVANTIVSFIGFGNMMNLLPALLNNARQVIKFKNIVDSRKLVRQILKTLNDLKAPRSPRTPKATKVTKVAKAPKVVKAPKAPKAPKVTKSTK